MEARYAVRIGWLPVVCITIVAGVLTVGCGGVVHQRPPVGSQGTHVHSRYEGLPLTVLRVAAQPARSAEGAVAGSGATSGGWGGSRASAASTSDHKIASGETLWSIAQRYGTTVAALQQRNPDIDPRALRAGSTLRLPGGLSGGSSGRPAKQAGAATRSGLGGRRAQLSWPVEGVLTSRFGRRGNRPHDGIDIGADRGTRVKAADSGVVLFSDRHGGYGNLVVLKHGSGLVTVYAHHQRNMVRKGQRVRRGQVIATVGATGRATGPHLHFEVRRQARPQNPLHYLPP